MSEGPTTRIPVLLLTDSKETADLLTSLLAAEPSVYLYASRMAFGEGVRAVARREASVVVLADTLDSLPAAVEELDSAAPGLPCLAVLPEGDLKGAQECTLAGARATLFKPFDHDTLVEAIQQVYTRESRRRQHLASSLEGGPARPQRPRVIAVHGAKGGVGTTTIASNLAASLHQQTGRRVALVDADLFTGDAGVLCDVAAGRASRTISDLLPAVRELDADFLDSLLARHATGVRVLLAPDQVQRAEAIRGEDMQRTLAGLKPYFDYTVVDTPSRVTPVTLAALDEADLIVLVVTPELVALRDAARFLQLATQLGYPEEKIVLVVNRANAGRQISPDVVQQQLRRPIAATVPSDGRTLVECMCQGELIVAARPRHKVAGAITRLARDIAVSFGWDARTHKSRPNSAPTRPPANGHAAASAPLGASSPAAPAISAVPSVNGRHTGGSIIRRLGRALPFFGRNLSQRGSPARAVSTGGDGGTVMMRPAKLQAE